MTKNGLDYFPLSCQFDDKIELIEAEFGLRGIAIVVKLYQKIYGECGYYCDWNDEVALLFSRKQCSLEMGDNVVSEVIKVALKRDVFDNSLYSEFGILTSAGIQKRYLDATKRRNEVEIEKHYLLLNDDKIHPNARISSISVYKNKENVYRNQQSKGKESKGKESKEREKKGTRTECFFENEVLEKAFRLFLTYRKNQFKETLADITVAAMAEELKSIGQRDEDRIAVINKAIVKGWKNLYPMDKPDKKASTKTKDNKFNNLDSRTELTDELEQVLLKSQCGISLV